MDPQALELANKTLADALDTLLTGGSPFVPLIVIERNGQYEHRRLTTKRGEDAAARARGIASSETDAQGAAFAVTGIIPFDDHRFDGLLVEAWNFRTSRGARIGLRYEMKGALRKKASLIGGPLFLEKDGWYDPDEAAPDLPVPAPVPVDIDLPAPEVAPTAAQFLDFPPPLLPSSQLHQDVVPQPVPPLAPVPVAAATPVAVAELAPEPVTPLPAPPVPVLEVTPAPAPADVQPAPTYVPVPIQRTETPLGNRAIFTGVMELATKGRSFPAFAIVQKDGTWEQVTMTDANIGDSVASVRAYARTRDDAEFIAFVIDGYVFADGAEVTAVIAEIWDYATKVSLSVAQRYTRTGNPPSPRITGRPLMRTASGWVGVPSSMVLGGQVQFGYRDPDAV